MVKKAHKSGVPYKKAGVVLSGLMPEVYLTGDLFIKTEGENVLDTVADQINERFGHNTVRSAVIRQNPTRSSAKLRSQEYTTRWGDIPTVRAK
jgi:DNA polymerase V